MYTFQDFYIPDYMMPGIELYIKRKVLPGNFLQAIICNNLREAVAQADVTNIKNIPAYVSYFYNEAPIECWGSVEKMNAWILK